MMQTKFVILASIFGVITGLSFSTNQNIILSIGTALIASAFGLAAYFSKDKKDKQIEEIHQIATTKNISQRKPVSPEEQEKLIALIKESCHSKYSLRNNELYTKFESILDEYASRGFDLLPGIANGDITVLYLKELRAFSDILNESILEVLNDGNLKVNPQQLIVLARDLITNKSVEIETLHCEFINHYFQTTGEEHSNIMKDSFKKQIEYESSLNISKISSMIELKNMA